MKADKWEDLDSAIVEYIKYHHGLCPANSAMLEEIARKMRPVCWSPWRRVDKRTQALRKTGLIKLDSHRKWVLAK